MSPGCAGAIGNADLQGCLGRWFVYTGIHINAGVQGFPAEYHTVAKWSYSLFQWPVVLMLWLINVYGRSSLACERKDGLTFELTS